MNTDYSLISSTAKLTAHLRADTDIPYSKEIDELCDCKSAVQTFFGDEEGSHWKAPKIESRYKCLSKVLEMEMRSRKITQVLELAAGILPRGMIMSADPQIRYVETDLPGITEEKRAMVAQLNPSFLTRENYLIRPLDVLDTEEFLALGKEFPHKGVAIIHEGLLAYLSVEEKRTVAENIHSFLSCHGGVWITPDLSNSESMKNIVNLFPEATVSNKKIGETVKRDMKANSLGSREEALDFYKSIGFSIREYIARDLAIALTSLENVQDVSKRNMIRDILDETCVWVLEVK